MRNKPYHKLIQRIGLAFAIIAGLVFAGPHLPAAEAVISSNVHGKIRLPQDFYAYMKAGEVVTARFEPSSSTAFRVNLVGPTGQLATCTSTSACIFTVLAPQDGVYRISYQTGLINIDTTWSINVKATDNATQLTGRVFTYRHGLRQLGNEESGRDLSFWFVLDTGVIYRGDLTGVQGIDSAFWGNAFGNVTPGTCTPMYKSAMSGEQGDPAGCPGRARLFYESPNPDVPISSPGPSDESPAEMLLIPPYAPPTISSLSFTNDSPTTSAGTFTAAVSSFYGPADLRLDINGDGDYDDPIDRIISWPINVSSQQTLNTTLDWDGLDGLGNAVPVTTTIGADLNINRTGELHVVRLDVEKSPGIELTALTGPAAGTADSDLIFWDDREVVLEPGSCAGSTTPVANGTAGVHSAGGVHGWKACVDGSFAEAYGNAKVIDDWTYARISAAGETKINRQRPVVDKTFVSATDADGDGIFDVKYKVTVTNLHTGDLTYDLTDTPGFDSDMTVTGGTATSATNGANAAPTPGPYGGTGAWTLASGGMLAQNEVHTYDLNFTVNAGAVIGGAAYTGCGGTPGPGQGLFNSATATGNGFTSTDNACGEAPLMLIDKTFISAIGTSGTNYRVSYRIDVRNLGAAAQPYSLTDTPQFDPDLVISGGNASVTTTSGAAPPTPTTTTTTPYQLATNQSVPAGATHSYTVNYDVNASAVIGNSTLMSACGATITSGNGLTNTATLTSDGSTKTDRACGELPLLTIDKQGPLLTTDVDGDGRIDVGDTLGYTLITRNAGQVDLTGVTVRDSLIPTADLTCTYNTGGGTFNNAAGGPLVIGATVTCTGSLVATAAHASAGRVVNTATADSDQTPPVTDTVSGPIPPEINISKSSAAPVSLGNGRYRVVSTISVRSTGAPTTYNLNDALNYGTGITVNSASATNTAPGTVTLTPGFNGTSNAVIASGASIGHAQTHTYTVTVEATIDPVVATRAAQTCAVNGGTGGFFNTATVIYNSTSSAAEACVQPPAPDLTITKRITSGPTGQSNNTFTINYQIVVNNRTTGTGSYSLSDEFQFAPGVVINSQSITSTLPVGLTVDPTWNGQANTSIASNQTIGALGTHTYNIRVNVSVTGAVTDESRACDPNGPGGLRNRGSLLDTTGVKNVNACAPIPSPKLEVIKTANNVTAEPDGTYTIVYDLEVRNSGPVATRYDLVDSVNFGQNITVNSASVTSADILANLSGWTGSGTIVSNQDISRNSAHYYVVTVNASVPAPTTLEARDCFDNDGPDGTGFKNDATLSSNGTLVGTDDACVPAPGPAVMVSKTIQSLSLLPGNNYVAVYDVVVTNAGRGSGQYQLFDDIRFGAGMTVATQSVTGTSPAGLATGLNPNWNGASDLVVTTGLVSIDGSDLTAGTKVHTYTFTVTGNTGGVDLTSTAGDCTIDDGETGTGFTNDASLNFEDPNLTDSACDPLPGPSITIDKSISSGPTLQANGTYSIEYLIQVSNTGGPGTYSLSDSLKFGTGLMIQTATASNQLPGTITTNSGWNGTTATNIVGDTPLAAGSTHSYRIVVVASVGSTFNPVTSGPCSTDGTAGGFANSATAIVVSGPTLTDDACAPASTPKLNFNKQIVSGPTDLGAGRYSLQYQISVSNTGGGSDSYSLADALQYGAGISVVSASLSAVPASITPNAAWNGLTNTSVVTSQAILAGANHTYTVDVVVSSVGITNVTASQCNPAGGAGGLRNQATLDSTSLDDTRSACAPLPNPILSISKGIASGPTLVGGSVDTYNITYSVVVTNSGLGSTEYSVTDAFDFGVGVTIVGTPTIVATAAPVGDTVSPLAWNGIGALATNQPISAETVHTYSIATRVRVAASTSLTSRDCDATTGTGGTGLTNNATLSGPRTPNISVNACAPVPSPVINISKSISTGPTLNADGTYSIGYTISVTNAGSGIGQYDLADQPKFGAGLQITSAAVTSLDVTPSATWNGRTVTQVIAAQPIAGGVVHTYSVVVTASVDPSTFTTASGACPPPGSGSNGGFANDATVTRNGTTTVDDACAPIAAPNTVFTKRVTSGPVDLGAGRFQIEYQLDAANGGDGPDIYDLVDELRLGSGVSVVSARVSAITAGLVVSPTWNGTTSTGVVTKQFLAARTTHSYAIVLVVDASSLTDVRAGVCDSSGQNSAGGLRNVSTLTNKSVLSATACAPIPSPRLVLNKTISTGPTLVSGTSGNYNLTYTITVNNAGDGSTTYNLLDQFRFGAGISVVSVNPSVRSTDGVAVAVPTGWTSGSNLATNQSISANSTHTYTLAVLVQVAPGTPVAARDCDSTDSANTGLANDATLSGPRTPSVGANVCKPLPGPELEVTKKVASGPVFVSSNRYRISYDILVENTGVGVGEYDLTDRPKFGAGISIISATVASTDVDLTASGWNGISNTSIVFDQAIGGGTTHSFRTTFIVEVTAGISPVESDCDPRTGNPAATGLLNDVLLSRVDDVPLTDDDCAPILRSKVGVEKTNISGPKLNDDGTYTIEYQIVVTHIGGAPTVYDLSDAPEFGGTIDIVSFGVDSSVVTMPSPQIWDPVNDINGIITGVALNVGQSHTYNVEFVLRNTPSLDQVLKECGAEGAVDGVPQLLNKTVVSPVHEDPVSDEVCDAMPAPDFEITKSGALINDEPRTDGLYSSRYQLTVSNVGDGPGTYELMDNFDFAVGTLIMAVRLTPPPADVEMTPGFNGVSQPGVAKGILAAGKTHTFIIEVDVDVSNVAELADLACSQDRATALRNTASVGEKKADVCVEVPAVVDLWLSKGVNKSLVTMGSTVVYSITVGNDGPADASLVRVEEPLALGLEYVSDDSGGAFDAANLMWNVGTLDKGETRVLNITAKVFKLGTIKNTAEVKSANEPDIDSIPDNKVETEDDMDSAVLGVMESGSPPEPTPPSEPSPPLAFTGADIARALGVALVLLTVGGITILGSTRRRRLRA